LVQIEHGQARFTVTDDGGDWMLPLSSMARTLIVTAPKPPDCQV